MSTRSPKGIWIGRALSLVLPLVLVVLRPMGMTPRQAIVAGALVLTITWWSTGLVGKIPASLFLLGMFALFGGAPLRVVMSFPLSETFALIVLTYLFSQGIANSGLTERTLEPILFRFVKTPVEAVVSVVLVMIATIYIIPQPLARLIILATIYRGFLAKTTATKETASVILFSIFAYYTAVNMLAIDADIILNTAAIGFAGSDITNGEWIKWMAPPTLLFLVALLGVIVLMFRRELVGIRLSATEEPAPRTALDRRGKLTALVVGCTILVWMAGGLLGGMLPFAINPTLVTLIAILLLFALGVLKGKDLRAIDVTTLVFLTAAFSIGGVMKASGIAELVFSRVARLFPAGDSPLYPAVVVLVCMGMHFILGSNTTTLSVVLPGLVVIGEGVLPVDAVLLLCYTSLAAHYVLPFHSVSMMIGSSNGYFPARFIPKLGIVTMALIILLLFTAYLPWWRLMGVL